LASTGYTVSDLLLRVKLNLLSAKIQQKVAKEAAKKPSQKEISSYYQQHKSQYGQPEKRDLLIILTKTQAQAEAAKREISSGKSFQSVAKSKSIDPSSKSTGGSLPGVVKGQEQKAFDQAIFAAKANALAGPVKTPFGYYLFEVKAIHAPNQQPLAQVQSSIAQAITAEKQQNSVGEFVKNFRKKWTARTECRSQYTVMDCKSYKAPKTPALPGTAAPPVTVKAAPATPTPKKK
jgi:foldase protein PrsA